MSAHWPPPPSFKPEPPVEEPLAVTAARPVTSPPLPHSQAPDERPWWRRGLSLLVVAGLFVLKFGKAALLLLPKAKILTTSGTMLVSIAAYSLIWGWKFAVG